MTYLVYKCTSPSKKVYIGYSSKTLEERFRVHQNDRQRLINTHKQLPRFYAAWNKYPIETWTKEVIQEGMTLEKATSLEKELIASFNTTDPNNGYNMALGGDGGNTGRNKEGWKRRKHSVLMKQRHKKYPKLASNSAKKNWENTRKKGQYKKRCKNISDRTLRGKNHWGYTGLWVVRHNVYETLQEAVQKEKLNEWTINEYCNRSDKIFTRDCVLGKKGLSRKECGFYRIKEDK